MNFTPLDLKTWPRGQMFYYFSNVAPTAYSLTVMLDVTKFRKTLREQGYHFFPAYLWLVTKKLQDFHEAYLQNQKKFGNTHGVLAQPQTPPPPNAYTISCIPWIDFSHFAVHSFDNNPYYFLSVEAGKITTKNGKEEMALSITCHHATTDGYHVHCFLKSLQEAMDNFSV